jgi:hypothetical protein
MPYFARLEGKLGSNGLKQEPPMGHGRVKSPDSGNRQPAECEYALSGKGQL